MQSLTGYIKALNNLISTHVSVEDFIEKNKNEDTVIYKDGNNVTTIVVAIDSDCNIQYNLSHIKTGHSKMHQISVKETLGNNSIVALFYISKGKGKVVVNNKIYDLKQGSTVNIKNNDTYAMMGDMVVSELLQPIITPETHKTLGDNTFLNTENNNNTFHQ